jgi:hypothetical protein
MATSVRFTPAKCPDCGAPVEATYAQYRQSRPHPLFLPLLILGVVALIVAIPASLFGCRFVVREWVAPELPGGLSEPPGDLNPVSAALMRGKALAAVYYPLWVLTLPVIGFIFWLGWRVVGRLPRKLAYECPACLWTGPVGAVEIATLAARQDERPIEVDDSPYQAKRERQQRRLERERRQAREREHESPPNPDFDFGSEN